MKKLLCSLALIAGAAYAQETAPVTPQQFVKSEGIKTSYNLQEGQLSPVDSLKLLMQCMAPASAPYDSDHDGKNDTLRVYGFGIVPAALYKVKGVMALTPAVQKAQLKANGAAAEFFEGLRTTLVKGERSVDSTAQVVKNDELQLSNVAVETVFSATTGRADAVLRGGRVTGHRIVSLGDQGICVVARYELPLDQSANPAPIGQGRTQAPAGAAPASAQPKQGFPVPAPGQIGDF